MAARTRFSTHDDRTPDTERSILKLSQAVTDTTRLRVLAEASRIFAETSLDPHETLTAAARHIAEAFDWLCVIRLLSEDEQWLDPAAMFHPNDTTRGEVRLLLANHPLPATGRLIASILSHGEPRIISLSSLDESTSGLMALAPVRSRISAQALMIAPLRAQGETFGSVEVWSTARQQTLNDEDRLLLGDLAHRAALTIANLRLYQRLVACEKQLRADPISPFHTHAEQLLESLTPRERDVLDLIARGLTNREIAAELHVSVRTVKGHLEHLFAKLNASNRTEAALRALSLGLVSGSN